MTQKITNRYFVKHMLFTAVVCACLLAGPGAIFAGKSAEKRNDAPMQRAVVKVTSMKGNTIISASQSFLVTNQTVVFDKVGRQIEAGDLPVPCKAKIYYYQAATKGKPVASKIRVKQVLNTRPPIPE